MRFTRKMAVVPVELVTRMMEQQQAALNPSQPHTIPSEKKYLDKVRKQLKAKDDTGDQLDQYNRLFREHQYERSEKTKPLKVTVVNEKPQKLEVAAIPPQSPVQAHEPPVTPAHRPITPSTPKSKVKASPDLNLTRYESNVPKSFKDSASALTAHLRQLSATGILSWSEKGEVLIKGHLIPGSSINELMDVCIRPSSKKQPSGLAEFLTILKKSDVPARAVANKELVFRVRPLLFDPSEPGTANEKEDKEDIPSSEDKPSTSRGTESERQPPKLTGEKSSVKQKGQGLTISGKVKDRKCLRFLRWEPYHM